jgi:hypothetical protein
MESIGIFIAGSLVTLIVATGLVLLLWAAVEDGRVQHAHETESAAHPDRPADVAHMDGGGKLEPVSAAAETDSRRT